MRTAKRSSTSFDVALLAVLFAGEGAAAFVALSLYKKGDRSLFDFLRAPAGVAFACSSAILLAVIIAVVWRFRRRTAETRVAFAAAVLVNVLSVSLAVIGGEVVIRALAVPTRSGPAFAGTLLLPHSWGDLATRELAVLGRVATSGSYLVFDERLGWSVGSARHTKDPYLKFRPDSGRAKAHDGDIYLSSAEGLRSPVVGMRFADRKAAHRVALVGDSFTFGLEVPYEDTWGNRLEERLGANTQVLNFGVDGYGVDQSFLRYKRDVLAWRPDIVIMGIIVDDLRRTMCVYGFMCFAFGEIPFPKPRFVSEPSGLRQINAPLPSPESLFARRSIEDIPFIDYDVSYVPFEWRRYLYHRSYLARFILARFPRWPKERPQTDGEERRAVNAAVLREFIRLARAQGTEPIIVVFPGILDFPPATAPIQRPVQQAMADLNVPYYDMTDCVAQVPANQRFVFLHYTPQANAAVASCLADSIRSFQRSPRRLAVR